MDPSVEEICFDLQVLMFQKWPRWIYSQI